ncbi:hypothetical protein AnigIFM60653_011305 [Aspergillus niger]|uniref:BTB domain-containing protein n=1 Tax=Aspergillus welwitschiae TaxID=1341132 RepID=A0A3F3PM73_9EURO|nr:hypothetical protein BDQ94DRAFT_175032 [Aspergillus welwitschiae]RDH28035.1 hypothetical protein BDQ94DRAFT_175032 [Aspergillus welwitschiae]GLA09226.1 hypothetical protein AnigIFM60653_011305 [Aspergillus niger]GLA19328.1 hypothetical protein AnigIFM62618_006997 [Aspergillus niger]
METPDYILDLEGEIFITLKYPNCEFVPCEQEGPQKVSSEVVDHELLQRWMGMAIDAGIMDEKYKKLTTVPFVVEPDDDEIQATELESGIWGIGGPPVDILPSSLLTAEERISRRRARDELEKKMLQLMSDESDTEAVVIFQASAKHLMAASSYFRSLLTIGMAESNTFQAEGRLSTTAECWDEDALLYVLRIIHCQHHELPDKVDLEMLGKVCVVADYYDVHDAVRFAARPWIAKLDPQGPDDSYRESVIWLWIGIFFRMPGVFKAASLALIKEGKSHMPPLGLPIPAPIVEEINARRIKAIEGLMDHIYHVEDEYLSGKRGCSFECSSMLYGALMKNMSVYGLSRSEFMAPFTHNSYTSLANLIDRFRQPRWYDPRSSKYLCWQYLEHECHDAHFWEIRAGRFLDDEGLELKDFIKMG